MCEVSGKQTNLVLLVLKPEFPYNILEPCAVDDVILVKYLRSIKHDGLLKLRNYFSHIGTKVRVVLLLSQQSACQSNEGVEVGK